jgi:hypothetical protein
MADGVEEDWPTEHLPDEARLYRRVPIGFYRGRGGILDVDGKPTVGAFHDEHHPGSLSTNWERYATPEATRLQGGKNPQSNGVVRLVVRSVLQIDRVSVRHSPDRANNNRAHTDIEFPVDQALQVRTELRERCEIELKPPRDAAG